MDPRPKLRQTIHQRVRTGMDVRVFAVPPAHLVSSLGGVASGPVSLMNIVNQVTDVFKARRVRRGANMA